MDEIKKNINDVFDDYYDEFGNLHIDARNKQIKKSETKNLVVDISSIQYYDKNQISYIQKNQPKLIIHHCNLLDD